MPSRTNSRATFGLIVGTVAVIVYTAMVGIGLLAGNVPAERSFLLMMVPCLVPAVWNLYGFLRADAGDNGLIVSAVGWFMGAMSLLTQHLVVGAQLSQGQPLGAIAFSPPAMLCGGVAITLVVTGAILSWLNFLQRLQHS